VLRGPAADIDLSALDHNLNIIRNVCSNSRIIAVVKADAYGHGSVRVAERLSSSGVDFFGVAYSDEAIALRRSGLKGRILVLFDCEDVSNFFEFDLVPVISDMDSALTFASEAEKRGKKLSVHMKIDTGMGRMGVPPDKAADAAVRIASSTGLKLDGLLSHFSGADPADRDYALDQFRLFTGLRDEIRKKTGLAPLCHMANSSAIFSMPETCLDAVRPGLSLYGYSSLADNFGLRPVMKIRSKIILIKEVPAGGHVSYGRTYTAKRPTRVAVVPVGYADGYSRLFSNNSEMLVRGSRAPLIGRVCMDISLLDVTDIRDVSTGDEVVLLGSQGSDAITASELAARIDTVPYEILTSLGSRSRREYIC